MILLYERIFLSASCWARLARNGLFAALFGLLALLCYGLSTQPGSAALLWLPNALTIAALARLDYRYWTVPLASISVANFLAMLVYREPTAAALCVPPALVEIVIGAALLRRQFRSDIEFYDIHATCQILLRTVLIAPLAGAAVGAAGFATLRLSSYGETWITWYVADAVGMLVMLPLALTSSIERWHAFLRAGLRNAFLLVLLGTFAFDYFAVSYLPSAIAYCSLPLLFAALAFDLFRSMLLNSLSVIFLSMLLLLDGAGLGGDAELRYQIFLYGSIALMVLPALLLGVVMQSNRRERHRLAENEQRWKSALEGSGQGVWDLDITSWTLSSSRELRRMLGLAHEGALLKRARWMMNIHPDDRAHVWQRLEAHIAGATPLYLVEYRALHADGDYRWFQMRGKVMQYDKAHRPLRMTGTVLDITASKVAAQERERLAEALQEEKGRLQVTLYSIGDGVISTDEHGCVTFINRTAEIMTGWTAQEAIGQSVERVFRIVAEGGEQALINPVHACLHAASVFDHDVDEVLITRSGERLDIDSTASPVRLESGTVIGAVLVFQNVSKARELQRNLHYNASHDALTGVFNRAHFEREIELALMQAPAEHAEDVLCMVDLDRFKVVNDSAGHLAGDELLKEISALLRSGVRQHDIVARLGGDEFGILLRRCTLGQAQAIAETLIAAIRALRFLWEGQVYDVGASMGLVPVAASEASVSTLLSKADIACYAAKRAGRSRASIFSPGQSEVEQQHREIFMAAGLREAIENNRFELYCQKIVSLHDAQEEHYEVLLRMFDRQGEIVPPGAFIPAAERYGMMAEIDRWVVHNALITWGEQIAARPGFRLSINLSANSLNDPAFLPYLLELMERSRVRPQALTFEITETALMKHVSMANQVIARLREAGCRVALDDFGSGLSSFSYLQSFAVDIVKIDGAFVRNVHNNALDQVIVDAINQIAHRLQALTIAEFVEDENTLGQVKAMGVDYVQGYYFGRPKPLKQLLALPQRALS